MPSQTLRSPRTTFYSEFDTAPPLRVRLDGPDGLPFDLTGALVDINIAYARHSHFYSPYKRIIDEQPCVVENQMTQKGWVHFVPGDTIGLDAMSPAGSFHMTFVITYPDTTKQTVPVNTYLPLIIRSTVGGTRRNT